MYLSLIRRKHKTVSLIFKILTFPNHDFSNLNFETLLSIFPFILAELFDFKIREGFSKGSILYGELRPVAREKEHCIPWVTYQYDFKVNSVLWYFEQCSAFISKFPYRLSFKKFETSTSTKLYLHPTFRKLECEQTFCYVP